VDIKWNNFSELAHLQSSHFISDQHTMTNSSVPHHFSRA